MRFVFRHLNIFTRPSSIDGHEWQEVHDPEIKIDVKVGLSCLLFLTVSAVMYYFGDLYGALFYVVVTLFSTLSDAVFVNHYYLDLIDRITAALGAIYMAWFTTQWFIFHNDYTHLYVWVKLLSQLGSGVTPFKFLDQCRQFRVRSKMWRVNHIKWHITGSMAMIFSILVSQGYLDSWLAVLFNVRIAAASVLNDLRFESFFQGTAELLCDCTSAAAGLLGDLGIGLELEPLSALLSSPL